MKIIELFQEPFINISNGLSLLRILLSPVIFFLMYMDSETGGSRYIPALFIVVLLMFISDFLDGFLARKLNQQTRLGQYLDPLADKLAAYSILVSVVLYRDFPLYIFIFGMVREILVVLAALYLFKRKSILVQPNLPGKATIVLLALCTTLFVLDIHYPVMGYSTRDLLAMMIIPFYLVSGIFYFKSYARYWFGR